MKSKFYVLVAILMATFTSCEKDNEVLTYVEVSSSQQDGLWGNVKSVETTEFKMTYDDQADTITVGDPVSKNIVTYDRQGFRSGSTSFRLQKSVTPMIFQKNEKVEYLYDNRYRLTELIQESYVYESVSSTEYKSIVYNNVKLDYNFELRNITATYTESTDGVNYVKTQVRVYGMKPNGALDADVLDIFNFETESASVKMSVADQKPEISSKRVVITKDALENWIKSYIYAEFYNADGSLLGKTGHTYKERTISYY